MNRQLQHSLKLTIKIHDVDIENIKKELLDIIPDHISPAISVKKIMSEKPMVLSPENLARDASELMKRYGYEGYPVIENGNVHRTTDQKSRGPLALSQTKLTCEELNGCRRGKCKTHGFN